MDTTGVHNATIKKDAAMAKQPKIVPTKQEEEQELIIPLQLNVNTGATLVNKYDTPNGIVTELVILSPVGISISLKMDANSTNNLVTQLTGGIEIPKIEIAGA